MKTFSKALSVLLSIAMLLSMVSVSVFAQDVELIDASDVEIVEAEEPAEELAEEPAEEEIVEDEIVEDEIVEDEVVEDEIVEDEIVEDEIVEDEIVEDEIVEDEIVEDEIVEDEEVALAEEEEEVFLLGATDGIYVSHKKGDDTTGDGTEANPYKSLATAKAALGGADGKIYIVDAEWSVTTGTAPDMLMWNYTLHEGTITYVGVDPNGNSAICLGGTRTYIGGNTKFENLTIVSSYAGTKDWRYLVLAHNTNTGTGYPTFNCEFDDVSFIVPLEGDGKTYTQASTRSSYSLINSGIYGMQWNANPVYTFANGTYAGVNLNVVGNSATPSSITVNAENATVGSIDLCYSGEWNNHALGTISTEKLFVNIGEGSSIGSIVHTATAEFATIKNLQILNMSNNAFPAISDAAAARIENTWLVKVRGGELVATSTPGTFSIPAGHTVYWYESEARDVVKYVEGSTITLPTGTHILNITDDFDAVVESLVTPEAPDGQTFLGWVDDGNGALKATFIVEVPGAIYVSNSLGDDATADGTIAHPYKTLVAAQTALGNANGTIAILGDTEFSVTRNSVPDMLIYGDMATHSNTITIVGTDPDGKSAFCVGGTNLGIKGPVKFKNLTIVTGYTHNTDWNFVSQAKNGGTSFSFDSVRVIDVVENPTTHNTAPITNYGPMFISNSGFWTKITLDFINGSYGALRLTPQSNDGNQGSNVAGITVNVKDAVVEEIDISSSNFKSYNYVGIYTNLLINVDNSTITNGIIHSISSKKSQITNVQILLTNASETTIDLSNVEATNKWIITADGTLTATSTPGTLTIPAGSKVYNYVDNYTVEYVEGSITLPAGTHNLKVAEGDITAVLEAPTKRGYDFVGWVDDGEGTVTAQFKEVVKVKHIVDPQGAFVTAFEGASSYVAENTTLHGIPVKKITNPGTGTNFNDMIYTWSEIKDIDGKSIPVTEARYITINYFYESDSETPALEGGYTRWNQIKNNSGTYIHTTTNSGSYTGEAPNTFVANQWATITIDMTTNENFADWIANTPDYKLKQYKFDIFNDVTLPEGDAFYLGDIWFTAHDPALDLDGRNLLFVDGVNGSDDNNGSSPKSKFAVKSFAKAFELASAEAKIFVCGDATYDVAKAYDAEIEITSLDKSAPATVTFAGKVLDKVTIHDVAVAGTLTVDGGEFVAKESVTGEAAVTVNDGVATLCGGTYTVTVEGGDGDELINVIADGATVATATVTGDITSAMLAVYEGTTVVSGDGTVGALTLMNDKDSAITDNFAGTAAKYVLTAPAMESDRGVPFSILATEDAGVYATWNGTERNYGSGFVTYAAYTYSADGKNVYYSASETEYTLTLPETGAYIVKIQLEEGYKAGSGAQLQGFTTSILTLPTGANGWVDDGNGTITATYPSGKPVYDLTGAIYVSMANGNDEWDGLTAATAKKTLGAAQAALGKAGTIVVMDTDFTATMGGENADLLNYNTLADHSYTLTIVGLDEDGKSYIYLGGSNCTLKGPTVFRNLRLIPGSFAASAEYRGILGLYSGSPKYTFDDVQFYSWANKYSGDTINQNGALLPLDLIYPTQYSLGGGTFTFNNGSYGVIHLTNFGKGIHTNEPAVLTVNVKNATAKAIAFNHRSYWNEHQHDLKAENVFVNLDNATITEGFIGTSTVENGSSVKNLVVLMKNGSATPAMNAANTTVTNAWYVTTEAELASTTTAGTFTVPTGANYQATSAEGEVVLSNGSTLVLPAGTWTVISLDGAVESDGTTITIKNDTTVDLTEYAPAKVEGKTFIGWKLEDGTPVDSYVALKAGDKLVAQYIDFDNSVGGDLSVLGTQIRNAAPMGMRYISKLDYTYLEALKNVKPGSYFDFGSIILPANILDGKEIAIGSVYGYNGSDYQVARVSANPDNPDPEKAGKLRVDVPGEYCEYTVVLTNIKPNNYTREYTTRSYIAFTDLNGNVRYVYGDAYTTSIYKVAEYALAHKTEGDGLTELAIRNCLGIIGTGKETTDVPASYIVFDRSKYVDSSSADSITVVAPKDLPADYLTEENYQAGKVFYKLENDLRVREIHIPIPAELAAKNDKITKTVIAGVSDTHLSAINDADREDAEIMTTYQMRTWLRDGGSIPLTVKAMNFAGLYDQVLLPGDILDYMAQGAMELVKEYILTPYKDKVMITLGNHDAHKHNQSPGAEVLPMATRQQIVEDAYASVLGEDYNIFYDSKIINDTVMAVMLENGEMTFHEDADDPHNVDIDKNQAAKLRRDIEIARENGYVMIVALHVPVRTLDESQTAVEIVSPMLTSGENDALNVYNDGGRGLVMMPNNDASNAVYDLIIKNADVIRAVYAGHKHADYTSYLKASYDVKDADGNVIETVETTIPQYVGNSAAFSNPTKGVGSGNAVKFVFDVVAE